MKFKNGLGLKNRIVLAICKTNTYVVYCGFCLWRPSGTHILSRAIRVKLLTACCLRARCTNCLSTSVFFLVYLWLWVVQFVYVLYAHHTKAFGSQYVYIYINIYNGGQPHVRIACSAARFMHAKCPLMVLINHLTLRCACAVVCGCWCALVWHQKSYGANANRFANTLVDKKSEK